VKFNIETPEFADFPKEVQDRLRHAKVTVIKEKTRSSVYWLENQHGYLKVTPRGQLKSEALMTEFLSASQSGPQLLLYTSDDSRDYLMTEEIRGRDAASEPYLLQPERLADVFGESLSALHRLQVKDCPVSNTLAEMTIRAIANYQAGRAENSLLRYMRYISADAAYEDMLSLSERIAEDDVIIHGDYCLPNLILLDFITSGYVDAGYGGIGDRHYDLFWGIWSLQFNLKTDRYTHRFLKAYGEDKVDPDRLRYCGLLSVFNGFRGQDYYE